MKTPSEALELWTGHAKKQFEAFTAWSKELTELSHHEPNSRLSCQLDFTEAMAGLRVTIAPDE